MVAVSVVPFLLAGCQLVRLLGAPPSVPETSYTQGLATIRVTSNPSYEVVLDKIGDFTFMASLSSDGGAQAEWSNDDDGEWLLTVLAGAPRFTTESSLWIEHYQGEPPLEADGDSCAIEIVEASPTRFAGTAHCTGLRWRNAYESAVDPGAASPLPGLPPFDATITFEARP